MSAQTRANMEAAIQAHIADECDGGMAVDWVMFSHVVQIIEPDDNPGGSSYFLDASTPADHVVRGLLGTAHLHLGEGGFDD